MINKNKILGIVIGVVAVVLIALSGMLFEDARQVKELCVSNAYVRHISCVD